MPEATLAHKRSQQRRPLSLLFSTEADDGSFFVPLELAQRLNLIRHLIQHSEQLLLILADQGSGKSTLLYQIKIQADKDWKVFNVCGHPDISEERLLKNLLNIFNVRSDGKTLATLRETLRSHIAATRYNNQLPLLLVDDAHMLPLDTLHLLLDLVMTGEKQTRLRMVLFCEPQITSVFAAPEFSQVRNTLIHTLDIPSLSERQVDEYLKFRLEEGRYTQQSPFSGMTVRTLFEQSEGRIGRLNPLAQQIMNQALEERLQHQQESPAATTKTYKIAGLGIFLVLFVGLLLGLQWLKDHFFAAQPVATESLTLPKQPLPLHSEIENSGSDLEVNLLKPAEENQGMGAQSLPNEESQEKPQDIRAATLQVDMENVKGEENSADTDNLSVSETPETAPKAAAATAVNNSEHSSIAGVKSAHWLSQQNAQHYSIQILGSYTLEGVSRFIRKYNIDSDMAMYLTQHNKRDWYVLIYGIYPTRQEAQQALRRLPSDLRSKTKPWLRSVSSIQAAIARRAQ